MGTWTLFDWEIFQGHKGLVMYFDFLGMTCISLRLSVLSRRFGFFFDFFFFGGAFAISI